MLMPTLWNIPYQRNPFFTGREEVLTQPHNTLQADARVALSHPLGISGLGGIGKTQMALEYAYRYRTDYQAIFWVRADSVTSLTSSLVELAHMLELPERNEQSQEIIVQAVLRWFHLHYDWLLIYDNIDDFSIAEPFLPKAGPGHLLFTTRTHAFGEIAQRLDIEKMELEIGALLLLRRASFLALQATLNMANSDDQSVARAISQELDGLPLALDQAGAYIKEAPCPLPDYLARYQTRRSNILQERGNFDQNYPASVATTWSLSFEKVSQANPAAAELLKFCAFLAPDAIPEEILTSGAAHLGPVLSLVVTNPIQLDQVYKEVLRYSLVQRGGDEHTLTIHRLVQAVLRDTLPTGQSKPWFLRSFQGKTIETQQQWMQRAVLAVNTAFPDIEFAKWQTCERLLPHAFTCVAWIKYTSLVTLTAARLLNQTGYYLKERERYGEAEPLLVHALAIKQQQLGAKHPSTALSLNNLASLYESLGKYGEAEPLYQRALAIDEQQLKAKHPFTAHSLNNLALLYTRQGKYGQAEPLLVRALAIDEQQLGAEHPNTATSLNNLALLYTRQGKYEQAEPLLVRALAIREQQLGAEHSEVAASLSNLASLYQSQGKYAQAKPLYVRALAIRERQLGAEHPSTATSLDNLASLYESLGKYGEAEPLLVRVLAIRERQLGAEHPSTATSLNNLASLYDHQRKYAQAEPLYVRALAIRERQLGAEHPSTATSLDNLAGLYESQGKYGKAEPLLVRALTIREQQLGAEHPSTATSLNNLALLYMYQKKYGEAELLLVRALAISERQLGAEHSETAIGLSNLADLDRVQGKYKEAELLYERALTILENILGRNHPSTHAVRANYTSLFQTMRFDKDSNKNRQFEMTFIYSDRFSRLMRKKGTSPCESMLKEFG